MALAITATLDPTLWAVDLAATGGTGTVSWSRDSASGHDVRVGDGAAVKDRTAPLGEPVTYSATDDLALKTAPPITIATPGGLPVLASTMYSTAYAVTVVSYRPYQGEGRSVWHPVIGRSDPLVSIFPAMYPAGELVVRAATNTERTNLVRLMQPGDPLLLRSTCHDRLDTITLLMLDWSDPYLGDAQGGPCDLRIRYQRVTDVAPAWTPPPDRTWQTIKTAHATFQVVKDTYPTLQAMRDGLPA